MINIANLYIKIANCNYNMSFFFEGFYSSCVSTFHLLYIVSLGILIKKLK